MHHTATWAWGMLGLVPVMAAAQSPALLLAQSAPQGLNPAGYLVSEKLDGVRAFWDGRHLRTRGGQVVAAPDWFTRALPTVALDGELWLGRGQFERLSGLVRQQHPDDQAWRAVRYMVFELPGASGPFSERASRLQALVAAAAFEGLQAVPQVPVDTPQALQQRLHDVLQQGGEGLMLHRADASYQTGRSAVLLKLKPQDDLDAVVLAHVPGRGRFIGLVGALTVRDELGRRYQVGSGLTDAQRRAPPAPGSVVTLRYRGLTARGLPRHATLWRVREPGQ